MMRTRQRGGKQPCSSCSRLTAFDWDVRSAKNVHVRYVPMGPQCGENVVLREQTLARLKDAA